MNATQFTRLREIEAEQIRIFRLFISTPNQRAELMRILSTLKAEKREVRAESIYTPPEPLPRQQIVGRMKNSARAAYF